MLTLLAVSCNGPATPHQIQNAHMDRSKELYGAELVTMVDNAMLQDMTVSDLHFVAHTSELSGTGAARLDHMAGYLNTYGGVVRYATHLTDGDLVAARIKNVGDYLELSGCDMDRIKVENMISGGRTTPADSMMSRGAPTPVEQAIAMELTEKTVESDKAQSANTGQAALGQKN